MPARGDSSRAGHRSRAVAASGDDIGGGREDEDDEEDDEEDDDEDDEEDDEDEDEEKEGTGGSAGELVAPWGAREANMAQVSASEDESTKKLQRRTLLRAIKINSKSSKQSNLRSDLSQPE